MTTEETLLQVGVKIFLKNSEGKYLILKRTKPYRDGDITRWDIPGGRINPGEPFATALKREVLEETGIKSFKVTTILGAQDILRTHKHVVRLTFLGTTTAKRVKLQPEEHTAYDWVTLQEFKKRKHDTFLKPMLKLL
jgi:8-oxo-dGTP diphosphatase